MKTIRRLVLFGMSVGMLCLQTFGQPNLPPPCTNCPLNTNIYSTNMDFPRISGILLTTGGENLLVDTLPAVPNPAQTIASWATIHSGGLILTTNGLIDTNAPTSDDEGFPAGSAVGVVLSASISNVYSITRGEFQVLLTNSNGELDNTKFVIQIARNTNDFSQLFREDMALAEYIVGSSNLTLTPINGTSNTNLYSLAVTFPQCALAASRVVSIRTEPLNFDMPFAQLQWLIGTNSANVLATYTTDKENHLVLQGNTPAMRLWTMGISGASAMVQTCLTPMALNVFAPPGTTIATATNATDVFIESMKPDENGFGGAVDLSTSDSGFFKLLMDTAP